MKLLPLEPKTARPTAYVCPMHPEVAASWAGTCPDCGMALRPTHDGTGLVPGEEASASTHAEAGLADHAHHGAGHGHDAAGGIEWEDDMVDVNRLTTRANMHWNLIDRQTGAINHAIDWQFRVGDLVKLRLVNEMDSDHPMHHPFHIHGAGRFVVLARDGVAEENLVWKDTVLLKTGATVDILLDVTNAGVWMAHCHIAEHHESGMMFSFNVIPEEGD
jgi:FtsP/CotA-like multicopper oxidase with cupredoxin domain